MREREKYFIKFVPRVLLFSNMAKNERTLGTSLKSLFLLSGRKNVLRKLLRIPYRRLKAGISVC